MDRYRPDERREKRHASHADTTYAAFLKDLCRIGKLSDEEARRAAVAVLRVLEQRLTRSVDRNFEAQLPTRLVELLHEAERAEGEELLRFGRQRLLRMVGERLGRGPDETEAIVRAVFQAVRAHISDGEAEHVASGLPEDIKDLWRHPL